MDSNQTPSSSSKGMVSDTSEPAVPPNENRDLTRTPSPSSKGMASDTSQPDASPDEDRPKKLLNRPRYVCEKLRRSSRKTSIPQTSMQYEPFRMGEWKNEERLKLLQAMKKYGHDNMEALCKAVPSRTPIQISSYIRSWRKLAQNVCQGSKENKRMRITTHTRLAGRIPLESDINLNNTTKPPIDQWLELIEKNMPAEMREKSFLVGKAFKYISLFEGQPDPANCKGVNFSMVYDFMYRMCNGLPYKNMNKETAQYILDLINGLARHVACSDYRGHLNFLDTVTRVYLGKDHVRRYSGKKPVDKTENHHPDDKITPILEELADVAGLNPLGMPMDVWKSVRNDEIDLGELLEEPVVVKTIGDLEKDFKKQVEKIYKKPVQWWAQDKHH